MRYISIVFLLGLCIAGCRDEKSGLLTEGDVLQSIFPVEPKYEVRSLSEIFSHIEYLSLETTAGSEIGHIDKALFENDRLYLLDKSANSVLCFQRDGSFIGRYSAVGRGPDEYRNLMDIDLLPNGRGVVLLADFHKLFLLDGDLQLQESVTAPVNARGISAVSSYLLGYYTGGRQDMLGDGTENMYNLVLHSRETDELHGLFPNLISKRIGFSGTNRFVRSDVLAYINPIDYSCYFLSHEGIDSVWVFDFGNRGIPYEDIEGIDTREGYRSFLAINAGRVTEVDNLSFSGDIFYFAYKVREGPRQNSQLRKEYYADRKTGLFYPLVPDANDLSTIGFPPLFLGVFNDGFFGHLPSFVLSHESIKELPESLSDVGILDNPVIVFYHVKK